MRVLVVEDHVELASLIRTGLREEGLLADVAIKGEDALWMAASSAYDVLTLDARLSGIDGFEVCRRLRDHEVRTPILMLTALDAVEHRIAGLDAGAADGMTGRGYARGRTRQIAPRPDDSGARLMKDRA
jgi:two-component system, OmpR family, response regulator